MQEISARSGLRIPPTPADEIYEAVRLEAAAYRAHASPGRTGRADKTRQAMTIKQAQKQVKQALRDHGQATSEGRRLKAAYDHILARTFLDGVDHGVRLERKRHK